MVVYAECGWSSQEISDTGSKWVVSTKSEWAFLLRLLFASITTMFSASLCPASLVLEGDLTQGGLVRGKVEPGTKVEFEEREVRVSDKGLFLIGFGRDAPKHMTLTAYRADGSQERRTLTVRNRQFKVQRIDGLLPSKVTPAEKHLGRIRAEADMVKATRQLDDPRTDFMSGFIWPVKGPITGVYGSQRILNGKPRRPHYGIDIAAPAGTPVRAPADGLVTLIHQDMYYSGGTLILDHGHGLSSSFLHLEKILVNKGQPVHQGEVIALVGATGRSKGAHLDWRINLFQTRLDPGLLIEFMPGLLE